MDDKRIIPVQTLSDVVNEYMNASFNNNRKYYVNYLKIARRAWKHLFMKTMFQVVSKYVKIDKSTIPYTIPVPADMERFLNFSDVDDCNNLKPYAIDNYMNILNKPVEKKCVHHQQGGCSGGLCDAITTVTVRINSVVIDGQTYTEKIWNRLCDNGNLLEVREVPVQKFETNGDFTVVTEVQEKLICALEVNEVGCVLPTPENKKLIINCCGCFLQSCIKDQCDPVLQRTKNDSGRIRVQDNKIFVDTANDWGILTYQTDGESCGEEILVPNYAVVPLLAGMYYFSIAFRSTVSAFDKREAKNQYNAAVQEMDENMTFIRMDEFLKVQETMPKW